MAEFWDGYVDGFDRWVRRHFDLAGHPNGTFPTRIDLPPLIAGVTARAEEMTGIRGCAGLGTCELEFARNLKTLRHPSGRPPHRDPSANLDPPPTPLGSHRPDPAHES